MYEKFPAKCCHPSAEHTDDKFRSGGPLRPLLRFTSRLRLEKTSHRGIHPPHIRFRAHCLGGVASALPSVEQEGGRMNSSILNAISAEVSGTVAQPANDVPAQSSETSATKKDSFCVRYAKLIEKYGDTVAYGPKGAIKLNETIFAAKFAKDIKVLFSPEEKRFYVYDQTTGLWEHTTEAKLRQDVLSNLFGFARDEGLVDEIPFVIGDRKLRDLASHLQGIAEERHAFGADHGCIHVLNGMLDLRSGSVELKPFDPKYRSRNCVPFKYVAEAKCPLFIEKLLKPALTVEDIDLLQRWAGSLLLGKNHAQRIMIITGLAGGGKSTLISILEVVVGEDNLAELRIEQLGSRFEKARFLDKLFLVAKDVRSDFLSSKLVSHLKSLTGGDRMTAELKGSNEVVSFRGDFGMVIISNANLRIGLDDDVDAWRRRLLALLFNGKKPTTPIPDFAGKIIREEGEGVLAWMVEGAIKHLAELKTHGGYDLTAAQHGHIHDILAESDSVRGFVGDCVVAEPRRNVTTEEMRDAYEGYCGLKDWTPVAEKIFREQVRLLMGELHGVSQSHDIERGFRTHRGYRKIQLKAKAAVKVTEVSATAKPPESDELPF